jgi:hypothetical protein
MNRAEARVSGNEVLSGLFADLYKLTGYTAIVEFDDDVGLFGVQLEDEYRDIIGAGACESEALEDAIRTARCWEACGRCSDCGQVGEATGHQSCRYPGGAS